MLFGPIVSLEMITGARRARYFIVRVLYALVLFVVLWINYSELISQRTIASDGTMSTRALAEFSRAFFATFAVVQMGAVLMLTPAMIAGSIAQERERRTIEYLFASTLTRDRDHPLEVPGENAARCFAAAGGNADSGPGHDARRHRSRAAGHRLYGDFGDARGHRVAVDCHQRVGQAQPRRCHAHLLAAAGVPDIAATDLVDRRRSGHVGLARLAARTRAPRNAG